MSRSHRHRSATTLLAVATAAALAATGIACSDNSSDRADDTNVTSTTGSRSEAGGGGTTADITLATDGTLIATVDPRFASYNIEMVEVTGGEFWPPYDAGSAKVVREPIDLGSERLRNLARELGPVYIRVSGSWANSTYFDAEDTTGGVAPEGYNAVLTPDQWIGVGEFAKAVDGKILTSFPSNTGARDADGRWNDDRARALLKFSADHGITIDALELFNEAGLPVGMPAGYTAADYGEDHKIFIEMLDEIAPDVIVAGPGMTADVEPLLISPSIAGEDLVSVSASALDVVSYHFYPKVSERCGSTESPDIALTSEFLSRVDEARDYYEAMRDRLVPGAPMWITETAQAACGGDRWAAQYGDVIRYVDTLGRLSSGDGDIVFHNTLAASDYGLLDEDGLVPRPNYWAAVIWARLMGPEVLATDTADTADVVEDVTTYARCSLDGRGVTYAVVNASPTAARTITTSSGSAEAYVLSGDSLEGSTIRLNGTELEANDDGTPPSIAANKTTDAVEVAPASVAFIVDPDAKVDACG